MQCPKTLVSVSVVDLSQAVGQMPDEGLRRLTQGLRRLTYALRSISVAFPAECPNEKWQP